MTMSTLAHRATAPVPARRVQVCAVASPPPGTGRFFSTAALRRTVSYSAVLGLVAGLQIVSANPASVASLANRAAPQTEAKVSARIEPAVESSAPAAIGPEAAPAEPPAPALDGALFSAILNEALPALQRIEPQTTGGISRESPDDILTFGTKRAPRWLVETILKASYKTGIDPIYMMTLADVESSLSPVAKAPTSSAEGLFQFIDRTWLEILYMHGAEHGFGAAAAAIRMVDDEPVVSDRDRSWILGLKRDPFLSALMAGELIRDIRRELQAQGERELSEAELYLAHFFGASSAVRFLAALDETPDQSAAKLFPKAARANLGLFTEKNGRKRRSITVAELYDRIDGKIVRRLNSFDTVARQERQPVRLEALAEPTTR